MIYAEIPEHVHEGGEIFGGLRRRRQDPLRIETLAGRQGDVAD